MAVHLVTYGSVFDDLWMCWACRAWKLGCAFDD